MRVVTFPVRSLRNHLVRSILTSTGIGAAVASLLALVGLSRGVDRGVILSLEDRGTHILALKKGSIEVLTAALDEGLAARLRALPGVVDVMAGLGDFVELETGEMAYMAGWAEGSEFWRALEVGDGRRPGPGETGGVVLGQALADLLGKKPGDKIRLSGEFFRVTGISKQASVINDRSVMMYLTTLQRLLGREGKVSGFHIRIDRPNDPGSLADARSRLGRAFPELTFIESSDVARQAHVTRLLRAMSWGSSTIALVMAFVTVLNTLLIAVTERTREIGLLSAIGWTPSRVVVMIVMEGVLMAAAGAALGVSAGLLGLNWMLKHPLMGSFLQPEVRPVLILQAVALAILVGALGSLYPAWRATRMRPMDLLRGE